MGRRRFLEVDFRRLARTVFFWLSEFHARVSTGGLSSIESAKWHRLLVKFVGPSYRTRQIFDNFHAVNPVAARRGETLPSIEVAIASTRKDFEHLDLVISKLAEFSANPIERVTVVVPPQDVEVAKQVTKAFVQSEEDLLPAELIQSAARFSQIGRRGWVIQQLIGLFAAWKSDAVGVLVCDSDTMMRARRTWINMSRVQILSYSYEYHQPYEDHCEQVWGARSRHKGLSYVTHYMLMQPDIIRLMFPKVDDLRKWIEAANSADPSSLADYHSYGRWLIENFPERAKMARWRNFRGANATEVRVGPARNQSKQIDHSFLSQSFHSYL